MAIQETKTKKVNTAKLQQGEWMSRLSYIKVTGKFSGQTEVQNEQGVSWSIGNQIVEAECYSCGQFDTEETMTRTQLVEKFNQVGRSIFTVCFNKQPKLEDAFDAVANKGTIKSNKELKKALSEAMKGEERILVGYVIQRDVALGRSMVVDLEQPAGENIRQVDHRSLNWFICENVKYSVKSR